MFIHVKITEKLHRNLQFLFTSHFLNNRFYLLLLGSYEKCECLGAKFSAVLGSR